MTTIFRTNGHVNGLTSCLSGLYRSEAEALSEGVRKAVRAEMLEACTNAIRVRTSKVESSDFALAAMLQQLWEEVADEC